MPKITIGLSESLYNVLKGLALVEGEDPEQWIEQYAVHCIKQDLDVCLDGISDNPLFNTGKARMAAQS